MGRSRIRQLTLRLWKRCPRCGETKDTSAFPKNRSTRDGFAHYCKPCHNAVMSAIKDRLYGGHRNFLLKLRYGIDEATRDGMIERQGMLCALCRTAAPIHIDHDHQTGRVRRVLCFKCNNGLGKFSDDTHRLEAVIAYLGG